MLRGLGEGETGSRKPGIIQYLQTTPVFGSRRPGLRNIVGFRTYTPAFYANFTGNQEGLGGAEERDFA